MRLRDALFRLERLMLVEALTASGGNVTAAAKRLGLHVTQARRLIRRHGLTPAIHRRDVVEAMGGR
jgi:transcriptional regulator with GAF, ATPase, and Fis domain